MTRLFSTGVIWLAFAALASAEEKTWEGRWNNKRFGTSGPLKCVASESEPGTWKAKFSGSFQGDPFSYDVTFAAKQGKAKGQQDLSGEATISGQDYEWKGTLKGTQLKGTYKSSGANFGEFVLTEPKKKKKK